MNIKTPAQYIVEKNIMYNLADFLNQYGKNFLIVASEGGFERFQSIFEESFSKNDIKWTKYVNEGSPTFRKAQLISVCALEINATAIVAIGGGRVIDTVKIAGSYANLPVITVPTIAATCAAWAAVSIVYNENDMYETAYFNEKCPVAVLVDLKIVLDAPKRFLNAGVIDTFAKWYEIVPYLLCDKQKDVGLTTVVDIAKNAFYTLTKNVNKAILESENNIYGASGKAVIDAIIFQAGLTGSLDSGKLYQGLAHPFYDASTLISSSNIYLHGEKVGYGLLVQEYILKKNLKDWENILDLFSRFNNVLTLGDLGITELNLQQIVQHIWENKNEQIQAVKIAKNKEDLYNQILIADIEIKNWRKKNG